MAIATKLAYQLLGRPPEAYRALCGGSKGIKVVGDEADLTQLRDWHGKVEILQGRLITAEDKILAAKERNLVSEIPVLAAETAELYAGVNARIGVPGVWWEIPPIMPEVSPWTALWYAKAASAFKARALKSVVFGFATGTPQCAPWAGQGDHGPDEWPKLYDCLRVLHTLGTDWVRIGVEEYITAGYLNPGDWSNVGRIKEVYERHIRPNGWNILFRGIEAGYDLPGPRDAGITAGNLLSNGLAAADARYAGLPYVDCMFLYAVCDPVTNENEGSFAFTPGNKNGPGYLETMQAYFAENKPAPFMPPKLPPIVEVPPVEPPPVPAPVELIVNGDFTGGVTPVPGNPNQQQMPAGWKARDPRDRVEIELDPHYRPPTARIIEAYEKREIGLDQSITVNLGETYRVTMVAAPWCTTDPSDPNNPPNSPSDSPAEIRLRVNGTLHGSLPVVPGVLPDQFMTITRDVVATVGEWTVGCGIKPEFAVARTDLRIDSVSVVKIKDAAPTTPSAPEPGLYRVVKVTEVNIRPQPNTSKQELGVYQAGKGPVPVDRFVQGQVINGNPWWGQIGQTYVSAYYLAK